MEKKCNICNTIKLIDYFYKNQTRCKDCTKQYALDNKTRIKEYKKSYREKNRELLNIQDNNYYYDNKDIIREKQKEYYDNNKEEIREIQKKYREKNKEFLSSKNPEYSKNYYSKNKNNSDFILKKAIRSSISKSFRNKGYTKRSKTYEILGCSFEEFKLYIESKFEPWMTWENRGLYNTEINYGWDIDHIIPLDSAESEEEIIRLNHYTNLQPLCSYTNRNIKK